MSITKVSKYSGAGAFVIVPVKDGAIVTKRDQKALGRFVQWEHAKFAIIHFPMCHRDHTLQHIHLARLSKPMRVVEITDAQFARRFKLPENIPGTGIRATTMQLERAFVIGD